MADISKISPDGGTTEYNVKDVTARANIGDLSELETTDKSDLVSAINEVIQSDCDVTGVKGNAELQYRQGNVSLSPSDIGVMDIYPSNTSFPSSGIYKTIYVAEDTGNAFYWNSPSPNGWSEKNQLADQDMAKNAILAVYNNALHLYSSLGYLYRWNSDTDEWILISDDGPVPYSTTAIESAMVEWNNELYVIPASSSNSYSYFYKWDGDNWTQLTNCPMNPCRAMVVYDNKIHIMTGKSTTTSLLHYEWDGTDWVQLTSLPLSFSYQTPVGITLYNNCIYLFSSTYSIKWNGETWSDSEFTVPYSFSIDGLAVTYNNELHLLESAYGHKAWNGVEWITCDQLIYNYYYADATVYQNAIHLVGGKTQLTPSSSPYSLKHYIYGEGAYIQMSSMLELGEDATTAYRGDRGKTAYDHATDENKISSSQSTGFYKFAVTEEGHIASVTNVVKNDITNLGIPAQDTTYNVVSKLANGLVPQLPNETTTTKYLRQDGTWAEPSGGGGGSSTFAGLSDVSITTPVDGDVIIYDATNQVYINSAKLSSLETAVGTVNTAFNSLFGE